MFHRHLSGKNQRPETKFTSSPSSFFSQYRLGLVARGVQFSIPSGPTHEVGNRDQFPIFGTGNQLTSRGMGPDWIGQMSLVLGQSNEQLKDYNDALMHRISRTYISLECFPPLKLSICSILAKNSNYFKNCEHDTLNEYFTRSQLGMCNGNHLNQESLGLTSFWRFPWMAVRFPIFILGLVVN